MNNIIGVKQMRKKNLLTMPKSVIECLQLEEGDHISFYRKENGDVVIKKLKT